ncbi:MAG: hypothetical protein P8X60_09980 [Robiginitalea sp.]|jgi:hypothetical protein
MKLSRLWAILFLVLFLGAKTLEYHPLGHDEDGSSDRCELCTFALIAKTTPFSVPEITGVAGPQQLPVETEFSLSALPILISQEIHAGQFYRPPPAAPAI